MGAFPGSLPTFQQITEASGSVVNLNALKIEFIFLNWQYYTYAANTNLY